MDADSTLNHTIVLGEHALEFLLNILPRAIGFGFLGFLLSLFVLVILHRRRVYTRAHTIWNLATKLHYPVLISVFIVFAFGWGALSAAKGQALDAIDERFEPYLHSKFPMLEDFVIHDLPLYVDEDTVITARQVTEALDKSLIQKLKEEPEPDGMKARIVRYLGHELNREITAFLLELVVEKVVRDLGSALHVGEDTTEFAVEAIMTVDFSDFEQEVIEAAVILTRDQTRSLANSAFIKIVVYFIALFCLLLVEPLFYYRWWVPRKLKLENTGSEGN